MESVAHQSAQNKQSSYVFAPLIKGGKLVVVTKCDGGWGVLWQVPVDSPGEEKYRRGHHQTVDAPTALESSPSLMLM